MAAVIGDPVRHSLSPTIHNAAFRALGLDWVYVALPVPAGGGADAVAAMAVLGIEGLSVTMPHKAQVASAVDRRTAAVETLGFCNCVFRDGGDLVGDSTDGDGLVRSLHDDEAVSLAGSRVLVIGTGGAASAIVEAVGRQQPDGIVIVSRDPARAATTAGLATMARPGTIEEAKEIDVIINASPVGMTGGPDPDSSPVPVDVLRANQVVVDIVYQPRTTALLRCAAAVGAKPVNGVGMLVHQAALAFERWTDHPAPVAEMLRAAFPADESSDAADNAS